jgi:hypothetical protein
VVNVSDSVVRRVGFAKTCCDASMAEVQDAQWASIHFWLGRRSMDGVERARGVQLRVGIGRMRIPGGVVCSGWLGMVAGSRSRELGPSRSPIT